jgi:hypothetical protein
MGQPQIVPPRPQENLTDIERHFSLMLGGPLYQLYLRTRLLQPPLKLVARRMVTISLICWLPLLLLSALARHLTRGVTVPFLHDPEVHARFLIAVPFLIACEVYVHARMQAIVPQFVSRGIIAPEDQARFDKIVGSALRLRNSVAAEVLLLILVLATGNMIWRQGFTLGVSTWYRIYDSAGSHLTPAGVYYAFVSLSIFRFLLIRWYFRLFVWYRFLWQVKALPLHFNLYHPDRVGGLGFLTSSVETFAPVFTSQSILVAGTILGRILYGGARLPDFKMEIAAILVFAVLVVVFPLGFFSIKLERAARRAKLEFGTLASRYVDDFHRKWIGPSGPSREPLLGTPDIQSLADLANSFAVVGEMRLLPVTKKTLVRLVLMVIAPMVPLMLTMFSLEEVIARLFKLAF